jgi:hypothetical protein
MTDKQKAMKLVDDLMHSFDYAYALHAHGQTEEMMLIRFDIIAAGTGTPDTIADAHRKVIRSAIEACDLGIPIAAAHPVLRDSLIKNAEDLLKQ